MDPPEEGAVSGLPGVPGIVDKTSDEAVTKNWAYNTKKSSKQQTPHQVNAIDLLLIVTNNDTKKSSKQNSSTTCACTFNFG